MNNLIQRILTVIVLTPLVLFLAFKAPTSWFSGLVMLIIIIGFYEFFKLAKTSISNQIITIVIAILFTGIMLLSAVASFLLVVPLFSIVIFWSKNLYLVLNYPNAKPSKNNFLRGVNGVFLLTPLIMLWFFNSLNHKDWLLLLFLIVWGADSFSYLFGKAFGKHKLAPKLSGGKTIEGVLGGVFAVMVLTVIWLYFNDIAINQYYKTLLLALITTLFSVVGDLYASLYKREAGVKDSGTLLPGHGGVLDRIDGLLAATPVFSIGLVFL